MGKEQLVKNQVFYEQSVNNKNKLNKVCKYSKNRLKPFSAHNLYTKKIFEPLFALFNFLADGCFSTYFKDQKISFLVIFFEKMPKIKKNPWKCLMWNLPGDKDWNTKSCFNEKTLLRNLGRLFKPTSDVLCWLPTPDSVVMLKVISVGLSIVVVMT